MTNRYDKMSQGDFDRILMGILQDTKACELISVPGFYEIVSEEFNNEVLDRWEKEQGEHTCKYCGKTGDCPNAECLDAVPEHL